MREFDAISWKTHQPGNQETKFERETTEYCEFRRFRNEFLSFFFFSLHQISRGDEI